MPELPEVEMLARRLAPAFDGRTLTDVWCNWPRMLTPNLRHMRRQLIGARLRGVGRRAKWMIWDFGPAGSLLLHLRMSGRPVVLSGAAVGTPSGRHVHFILTFGDCAMQLDDARKFGRAVWTQDISAATRELGIEPLGAEFTADWLAQALRARSRKLKPALLDQSLIAGLGNIYTDEALHRARLHPLRQTDSLRVGQIADLHAAIVATLQLGIEHNGASIDWVYPEGQMQDYFAVYGRGGQPCGRCGTAIRRLVVGQRGTHVCPRCQPAPVIRRRP